MPILRVKPGSAPAGTAAGRGRRLLRAVAYGVGFAIPLVGLAYVVRSRFDPVLRFDEAMIASGTAITREHPDLFGALIVWEEMLQPRWVYLVATLVCVWVWRRFGLTSRAIWAFVTMMACWNVALDLKYVVQRARPVVEDALTHAPGYSFPSGHAANSAAAASALVVLLWPLLKGRARVAAIGLAATVVVATAVDRVLLGVHYPSDVIAGVILGVGMVLASYAGYLGWNPKPTEHAEPMHDPTMDPGQV